MGHRLAPTDPAEFNQRVKVVRSLAGSAIRAGLVAFALALTPGCAKPPATVPPPQEQPRTAVSAPPTPEFVLSLLALNDLHGRIGALPAFGGYVEALRRAHGDRGVVAVVDAGDMFQGTLGSNQTEGKIVIEAYNALGVTAAALGNHEFDYGPIDGGSGEQLLPQGALRARMAEARFPFLSANLRGPDGALPQWHNLFSRKIVRVGGIAIGFLGVITHETPSIVMPDYFAGLDVGPLAPAVMAEATALRAEGAEVVVALAHAGADCRKFDDPNDLSSCDSQTSEVCTVMRQIQPGLVDAWVGGHTHSGIGHYVNGMPVVEALSRGKAFARIDLVLAGTPRRVVRGLPYPPEPLCPDSAELAACETHDYAGQTVVPSQALTDVVRPALESCRRVRDRALGVDIREALTGDHDTESPLGNLFTDLMREHVPGADAALANGGSLRATLAAGPLTYGALYDSMPFDNRLVTLDLTGAELRRVLETHFSHDSHGVVSLSGLSSEARCEGGALRVILRRPGGRLVGDKERLTVVTSDYVATGGDRLLFPLGEPRSKISTAFPILVRDALATQIAKRQRISPRDTYDAKHPRLRLPSQRPITCGG